MSWSSLAGGSFKEVTPDMPPEPRKASFRRVIGDLNGIIFGISSGVTAVRCQMRMTWGGSRRLAALLGSVLIDYAIARSLSIDRTV